MLELLDKSLRSVSLYVPVGYISQTYNPMFSVSFISEKSDTPHNFFPNKQNCVQRSKHQQSQRIGDDFLTVASNMVHEFFNHDTSTVLNKKMSLKNFVPGVLNTNSGALKENIQILKVCKPKLPSKTSKIAHRYELLLSFNRVTNFGNINHNLRSSINYDHKFCQMSKPCNLIRKEPETLVSTIPFLTFATFSKNQMSTEKQKTSDENQIKKSEDTSKIITKGVKSEESKKPKRTSSTLKNIFAFIYKQPKFMVENKPDKPVKMKTDYPKKTQDVVKQEISNVFEVTEKDWIIETKPKTSASKPSPKTTTTDVKLESDIDKPPQQVDIFQEEIYKVRTIEYVPYEKKKLEKIPIKLHRNPVIPELNTKKPLKPVGLTSYFFGENLKGLSILKNFKKRKLHTISLISQLGDANGFNNSQKAFIYTNVSLFKKEEKGEEEEEEEEEEEAEVEEIAEVESPYAISYDAETEVEAEVEDVDSAEESSVDVINKIEKEPSSGNVFDYNEHDSVNKDIEVDETPEKKFSGIQSNCFELTMTFPSSEGIAADLRNIWGGFSYPCGMDILSHQYQCDIANHQVTLNIHRNFSNGLKKFLGDNHHLKNLEQYSTCSTGDEPPAAEYRDGIFCELPYILVCDPEYEAQVSKRAGSEYKAPQYYLYHCYSFYDFFNYLALSRVETSCCTC